MSRPLLFVLLGAMALTASAEVMVNSKSKPDKPWKQYPTRTIDDLKGFKPAAEGAVALDRFGGWVRPDKQKATGFFYPKKVEGRWWLITPEGNRFIHVGVASVKPDAGPTARPAYEKAFGTAEKWAEGTAALLQENAFNGVGAWSDTADLPRAKRPVVYTVILNMMSGFGSSLKVTVQKPGHAGYPNDCVPVFHPGFAAHCEKIAAKAVAIRDDPWLLGYFSDNEMPVPSLEKFLALDAGDPNMGSSQKAAAEFVRSRGKTVKTITAEDKEAFVELVWDRYFSTTTAAIRKADPNHLCLGSRFHGADKRIGAAWRAAGKHLDVVSFNYYGAWTPEAEVMKNFLDWSGKPFMITEWYTKAEDSGMGNTTGAGWIVPTQKDRGLFYQNFTLALLESRGCVGWHWFKYQDNDPANLKTDPSNRDSNKGIVNVKFQPYADLLAKMKNLNRQVYPLTAHFDQR